MYAKLTQFANILAFHSRYRYVYHCYARIIEYELQLNSALIAHGLRTIGVWCSEIWFIRASSLN